MARNCKRTDRATVWKDNHDKALLDMWIRGKTPRQIAKELGFKPNEVLGRRAHLIKHAAWRVPEDHKDHPNNKRKA